MNTILYIFHVSELGGGSLCLLNIIKELDKSKFTPIVLLKNEGPLTVLLNKMGVSVFIENTISPIPYNQSLFSLNSIKQYYSTLSSLKLYKKWFLKINPDILHVNTMMMYPYAQLAYKLNKKVIIHMREHWPKNEHQTQFSIARYFINKYSDKIIAINKTSAIILNLPEKTEIVYDWIDFKGRDGKVNLKEEYGIDVNKEKVFLFLGGAQLIKGAYEVISVFSKKTIGNNVKLLVIGLEDIEFDTTGLKAIIKKGLRKINLPVKGDKLKSLLQNNKNIIKLPKVSDVLSLYQQVYCVVSFPTIPHAILPIAEAIWNRTPVISADTPEAREYSFNGASAKLVPINNIKLLEKAILYAINNEENFKIKTGNGVEHIKNTFNKKINSSKLNRIYSDMLDKEN